MSEMKEMQLPPMLDHKNLMEDFGLSRSMAYALLNNPKAGCFSIGKRRYLRTGKFLAWLDAQTDQPFDQGA